MRRVRTKAILAIVAMAFLATAAGAQEWVEETSQGGWMGLYIRTVDRDDIEALDLADGVRGVVVSGIDDEGPAAEAGIEPGDIITEFDGREVRNRRDFMRQLERRQPNERVALTVVRESGEEKIEFELAKRPRELEARFSPRSRMFGGGHDGDHDESHTGSSMSRALRMHGPTLGVHIVDLQDKALAEYFGVDAGQGVLVTSVVEDSGAEDAGMLGGDVIVAVGEDEVGDVEALRDALRSYEGGEKVSVRIRRKNREKDLEVELSESQRFSLSGLTFPRGTRAPLATDDVGDLRREMRELKRDLQRLEREMRRR